MFEPNGALFIVDPQNDFFPLGALPVPEGDKIIPVLNQLIASAKEENIPILVSRDWHPVNHCSFQEQGGIWPSHCVQETFGAAFHADLKLPKDAVLINKAFISTAEAYSAFQGQLVSGESLLHYLKVHRINHLWVGGLALDYCVKATVLDALEAGFSVNLVLPATRGISNDTTKDALKLMEEKGVNVYHHINMR